MTAQYMCQIFYLAQVVFFAGAAVSYEHYFFPKAISMNIGLLQLI